MNNARFSLRDFLKEPDEELGQFYGLDRKFKPGDLVALKSGGLPMTVACVDDEKVCVVCWQTLDGHYYERPIEYHCLVAVNLVNNNLGGKTNPN